jgi:hypothetical protein
MTGTVPDDVVPDPVIVIFFFAASSPCSFTTAIVYSPADGKVKDGKVCCPWSLREKVYPSPVSPLIS